MNVFVRPLIMISRFFVAISVFVLMSSLPVFARGAAGTDGVSGSIKYLFADYVAEEGGQTVAEKSHFLQKYSLLWRKDGFLVDGRLGKYSLKLGVEWFSLDSDWSASSDTTLPVDGTYNRSNYKILYEGNVLIAPGALPFRLNMFSYDSSKVSEKMGSQVDRYILNSSVYDEIHDGQHIISGVTLVAGIKNGSYMGQYREILSKYPRLFIDYRDEYVRSLDTLNKTHSRTKRLAFVSLNKKDNWFHYRTNEYTDYLKGDNSYNDSRIIMGTVDHTLKRHWVNMTNWLKISADGALSEGRDGTQAYNLNMFTTGEGREWRVSNFSNYSRSFGSDRLNQNLQIPIYGWLRSSPELELRGQLVSVWTDSVDYMQEQESSSESSYFLVSSAKSTHLSRKAVTPTVAIQYSEGEDYEGFGYSAQVVVESDTRYSRTNTYKIETAVSGKYGENNREGSSGVDHYNELHLAGSVERVLDSSLSIGASQVFRVASGNPSQPYGGSISIKGISFGGGYRFPESESMNSGHGWYSGSILHLQHIKNRWKNRLSALFNYVSLSDAENLQSRTWLEIHHALSKRTSTFSLSVKNKLFVAEDHSPMLVTMRQFDAPVAPFMGEALWSFFSEGKATYKLGRSYEIEGVYETSFSDIGEHRFYGGETFKYNIFTERGLQRRLFSFSQKFSYERVAGSVFNNQSYTLGGEVKYYPSREWSLGTYAQDSYIVRPGYHTITGGVFAEADYRKFKVRASYSIGTRDAVAQFEERNEQRVEVSLEKLL